MRSARRVSSTWSDLCLATPMRGTASRSARVDVNGPPSSASGRFFLAGSIALAPVDSLLRRDLPPTVEWPSRRAERPIRPSGVPTCVNRHDLRRPRRAHVPHRRPRRTAGSPPPPRSRPRPCPTRWPAVTSSAAAAPAPARPTRSCCPSSPGSWRRPTAVGPGRPRALILAPTRELATQLDTALAPLAKVAGLTSQTIFGGVGQNPQVQGLRRGVDVIVACPGRLEDLMRSGSCLPRRHRDHHHRRGGPHGRPRVPARRPPHHGHARRVKASDCCSRRRSTARSTSSSSDSSRIP